jgi:hypothetical protein
LGFGIVRKVGSFHGHNIIFRSRIVRKEIWGKKTLFRASAEEKQEINSFFKGLGRRVSCERK